MDKCLLNDPLTDKNTDHSYLYEYTRILEPYVNRIHNILEIGTEMFGGGSTIMFNNYFDKSIIYAVDIKNHPKIFDEYDRIKPLKMDAYCKESVEELSKRKYDFIIDDGSHLLKHQKFVASNYFSLLNEGGILIIEDIQDPSWCGSIISACKGYRACEIKDLRATKNRQDDMFIVFYK
tara:strand:+ start:114 stop:647 length:534 start_codon:yes stop_codon:yes gene_type:complete